MHQSLCPHTLRHQQRCLYSRTLWMYQMNAHLVLFCAMEVTFLGGRKHSWFLCVADSQTRSFRQIFFESRDFLVIITWCNPLVLDTHHALNELLPFCGIFFCLKENCPFCFGEISLQCFILCFGVRVCYFTTWEQKSKSTVLPDHGSEHSWNGLLIETQHFILKYGI